MSENFNQAGFWVDQWREKLEGYLRAPARAGMFIESRFGNSVKSTLELGAGSCRDSLYLASRGYAATASDFNQQTIEYLRKRFPDSGVRFCADDSRKLPYADGEFDVVFHNGLIVCFDDDRDVDAILREQLRVARKYAVILVHNGENAKLRAEFQRLGTNDALYRIRFYTHETLRARLASVGVPPANVSLLKFGGMADAFYGERIKGIPNPLCGVAASFVNSLYPLQPWGKVERIAAVVRLPGSA